MANAVAHNGGRSQVNPNFLFNTGEYAFLNLMKCTDSTWNTSGGGSSPATPDMFDSDGYPTTLTNTLGVSFSNIYMTIIIPSQTTRPGNYVVTWDGNGTIVAQAGSGSIATVSGSKTSSTGSGRYVFLPSTTNLQIGVASIGSPRITNIRLFHADDETALDNGDVFGVKFKEKLIEGKFGSIRFLNWMGDATGAGANSSNQTNWWTRKPLSFIWYGGLEMRGSIYTGLTTLGNTGAYTASAPSICSANGAAWDGVLRQGTTVTVLWDRSGYTAITGATSSTTKTVLTINTGSSSANGFTVGESVTIYGVTGGTWTGLNTTTTVDSVGVGTVTVNIDSSGFTGTPSGGNLYHTNLTLNVGSTGAKPIYGSSAIAITPDTNRYPIAGTFQSLATLTYDSAMDVWIKRGGDTAGAAAYGLNTGVPPEIMIRLCAEVGAHIWIPVPFMCCTPATDYLPSFIQLIQSSGPSWMKTIIEGPNELWNNQVPPSRGYAEGVANAYGWGFDYQNWYGKAISLLGQVASFMFGGDRTKYSMLCGVQTVTGNSRGNIVNNDPRLSSAKYINNTGGLQSSQSLTGSWGTINISATVGIAEAYRWTTHVTVANYIAPGFYGSSTETTLATAYAGGDLTAPATYVDSLNPTNATVSFTTGTPGVVNWTGHGLSANDPVFFVFDISGNLNGVPGTAVRFVKTVLDANSFTVSTTQGGTASNFTVTGSGTVYGFGATNVAVIPAVLAYHRNWKTWAQSFGVQKMCCYEGGYSPDYTRVTNPDLLRAAGKAVTSSSGSALGLLGYTQLSYANFMSLSDGTFTAEYPSAFNFGGKSPSNNAWSVLEDVYQSPNPPQFEAIRLFNNRLRRHGLIAST